MIADWIVDRIVSVVVKLGVVVVATPKSVFGEPVAIDWTADSGVFGAVWYGVVGVFAMLVFGVYVIAVFSGVGVFECDGFVCVYFDMMNSFDGSNGNSIVGPGESLS